jgi:hypothetical protein
MRTRTLRHPDSREVVLYLHSLFQVRPTLFPSLNSFTIASSSPEVAVPRPSENTRDGYGEGSGSRRPAYRAWCVLASRFLLLFVKAHNSKRIDTRFWSFRHRVMPLISLFAYITVCVVVPNRELVFYCHLILHYIRV